MSDCGADMCCTDDGVCDAGYSGGDDWVDTDDYTTTNAVSIDALRRWIADNETYCEQAQLKILAFERLYQKIELDDTDAQIVSQAIEKKKSKVTSCLDRNTAYKERLQRMERRAKMECWCLAVFGFCLLVVAFTSPRSGFQ